MKRRPPRLRKALPPAPVLHDAPPVDVELLKTLPPVLRAVVSALGFTRARHWLAAHGGVNVFIPRYRTTALGLEPDEITRLNATLAPHMDAAGRAWLPKADKLFIRVRDAQIRKERSTASINELARRNNLSSRHIQNICREDENRQADLF
jgi:hypothetical protein